MKLTLVAPALIFLIAFVVIAYTVKHIDPLGIGKRRANRAMPGVAEKLGLTLVPPESEDGASGLSGKFRQHRVGVEPGNPAILNVELRQRVRVHLSDLPPTRSDLNKGMDEFTFDHRSANKLFTTRFAAPKLVGPLKTSEAIGKVAREFNSKWRREIDRIRYSNGVLFVRFRAGNNGYIPARYVEPMLLDLIALAEALETL